MDNEMVLVRSPNPDYSGTSAGVEFSSGVGLAPRDPWILAWFRQHGYIVEDAAEKAAAEKAAAEKAAAEKAAAEQAAAEKVAAKAAAKAAKEKAKAEGGK